MGAVAYTSTSARRRVYLKELSREKQEMQDVHEVEKEAVRQIFRSWGYDRQDVEDLTERIAKNPKAMLELMMGYERGLAPVDKSEALRGFFIVGASTVVGSFVPLIPYLFVGKNILVGTELSVVISGITLFFIGAYEAKTTVGSLWRSGLQMAAIGLTAGLAGFLVGHFIGALPT